MKLRLSNGASQAIDQRLLDRFTKAGVRKPTYEYEKAHTYPASQPFFDRLTAAEAFAELPVTEPPFWTYVHVPFCNYMCAFCFYRKAPSTHIDQLFDPYLRALEREIDFARGRFGQDRIEVHDLYIGGGTPTTLSTRQLTKLLDLLERSLVPSPNYLGTIESSPEAVTSEKTALLLARGLSRISLGGQSWDQARLDAMGRLHRVEQTLEAYEQLRNSGCTHINVDLIYGLPEQTVRDWERELRTVLDRMRPESLTLYYLRYVPGTPLALAAKSPQRIRWVDLVAMRQTYFDILSGAGYEMCRPHHFRLPMQYVRRYRGAPTLDHGNVGAQIGFGPSAYSHVGSNVSRNAWPISKWLEAVESSGFGTAEGRTLTPADCDTRFVIKSLARIQGIDRVAFRDERGQELENAFGDRLDRLVGLGLLDRTPEGYRLTKTGVLLDEEISYFFYPAGFQERVSFA